MVCDQMRAQDPFKQPDNTEGIVCPPQVIMLVALHVLYAALGFIDPPEQEDTEASHFAHQSWSMFPSHQVGFSSLFKGADAV